MKKLTLLTLLVGLAGMISCKDDEVVPEKSEAPKPTVNFTFSQVEENDPFTYSFKSTVTNQEEVRWTFGDGNVSTEADPTYTFTEVGIYKVVLRATNVDNYWAEKELILDINADSVVNFTATPVDGGSLRFQIVATIETDSLFWDFGNGEQSTEFNPVTAFEADTFYNVSVRAVTPKGSVAEANRLVWTGGVAQDIVTAGTFSVSRDNNGGPENAEGSLKLIDGNIETKFLQSNFSGDLWVQLEFLEPIEAGAYTLASANDDFNRDPKNWNLQGSNDGENWTTLDTRSEVNFEKRFQTKSYFFENENAYRIYRLNITANEGAGLFQLAEWRLLKLP